MRRWVGTIAVVAGTLVASAQWVEPTADTPAYFRSTPSRAASPRILSGEQLSGASFERPFQVTVYRMAAAVAPVLFEQPCYCRCDRALRHKSLHSCFEGLHGAACATCLREAAYTYQQTKLGMSPAQIRAGVERGEWQKVDLASAAL